MVARRLAGVLIVACLAGSVFGTEGEAPAPADPRGTPPEAPAGIGPSIAAPASGAPRPAPAIVPPVFGAPADSGQGIGDRRHRLRGRLRGRLKALIHSGEQNRLGLG
jgi:hypothetical protein